MKNLQSEVIRLSGPLREPSNTVLYSSFHHPRFHLPEAQRNTLRRFEELTVPQELAGSVLDLGANLGAMAFEAVRRGASSALCVEYNAERVVVGNELAGFLGVPVRFERHDLNAGNPLAGQRFDTVFCCALDQHVRDRLELYGIAAGATRWDLFLESNLYEWKREDYLDAFKSHGLSGVYLGTNGDDQFCDTRRLFYFTRRPVVVSRCLPSPLGEHDDLILHQGETCVRIMGSRSRWERFRELYPRIRHLKAVPAIEFPRPRVVVRPWLTRTLTHLPPGYFAQARAEFVQFVRELNGLGLAHGDLHTENLYFDRQLWVTDWEFCAEDPRPLRECFDMTGQGVRSNPLRRCWIFAPGPLCLGTALRLHPADICQ